MTPHSLVSLPRRLDTQLLSDLYIFQQVVRAAGMGAAAREIGISQSAVSQRIARLEARLGCPLFTRDPGGVKLTANGGPFADEIEAALTRLADAIGQLHPLGSRTVHVNCTPSLAREWLVPALGEFYKSHPEITLVVYADQETMTPRRMADESIDIAIRYEPDALPGFVELAVVEEHLAAVRAPGILSSTAVRLHDETPWLNADPDTEWRAWEHGAAATLLAGDQRFNLASLAYDAAETGLGIAIGRLGLMSKRLCEGRLIAADERTVSGGAAYRFLARTDLPRQSAAWSFTHWAADHLARSRVEAREIINRQFAITPT